MNGTLGPGGIVLLALLFGEFPRISTRSEGPENIAILPSRKELASSPRKDMENNMANMHVNVAIGSSKHHQSTSLTMTGTKS